MGHRASLDGCGEEDVLAVPGFEAWTNQHVANHDNEYTLPQLSEKLPFIIQFISNFKSGCKKRGQMCL